MLKTLFGEIVRSPASLKALSCVLSFTVALSGCAPRNSTSEIDRILRSSDLERIDRLVASGRHSDKLPQGDENVSVRWWYPIHVAAFAGNPLALRALLEAGIDANERDVDGFTPMMHLIANSEAPKDDLIDCFRMLMEFGARCDIELSNGENVLHLAATYDRHYLIEPVVGCGVGIGCRDKRGNTPLHSACAAVLPVSDRTIAVLLKLGADPSARNHRDQSPKDLCTDNPRCTYEWAVPE